MNKIRLSAQCRICRQMAPAEAELLDPVRQEIDHSLMFDHNNPQGQLCEGSGKVSAFAGDWRYKADGVTRKAFSAECPLCHRQVQCSGRHLMIPSHMNGCNICRPSYFPEFKELREIPDDGNA